MYSIIFIAVSIRLKDIDLSLTSALVLIDGDKSFYLFHLFEIRPQLRLN